ncbi:DUF2970 domain-containing protein [Melaminivora sp.]|uniref:DUF2970 domain-containing protein n=1 Tax=Melaminivora sp. TaxID=1933032 RepID=UPI0028B0F1C4|nr:DUF2970 domain-containing protein [Melaminivora sp.]
MNGPRRPGGSGPSPRRASLARSVRAVAWSLIGLRAGKEYRQDLQSIQPLHVILIGLLALFGFVLLLIAVVKWVA